MTGVGHPHGGSIAAPGSRVANSPSVLGCTWGMCVCRGEEGAPPPHGTVPQTSGSEEPSPAPCRSDRGVLTTRDF